MFPGAGAHQLGQEAFKILLSEDVDWRPWATSGEYVTQITAMGPLGLEYPRATDDPRNNNS
jgi:hypothetical protein